jgi:transposase InsO family protein
MAGPGGRRRRTVVLALSTAQTLASGSTYVFIERLWRSLKYECVHLHAFETGSELRAGLTQWIDYYNAGRPHSALAGQTPDEAYGARRDTRLAA